MRLLISGLVAAGLSACGSGGDNDTAKATLFLDSQGNFADPITTGTGDIVVTDGNGIGYAYQVGINDRGNGFAAQSGVLPQSNIAPPPTTGTAQMAGQFEVRTYQNPKNIDGELAGDSLFRSGEIILDVDFAQRSVTGRGNGLTLAGTMVNGSLTGDATFQNVDGELSGQVGADQAVGAIAGRTDERVFAGGFTAAR